MSDTSLGDLSNYMALNLLSIPYLLRPALPHLRKTSGRIILISSGVSLKGYAGRGMYSMVKAWNEQLCKDDSG